jgi:endonuclease G, mitochondrial
MKTSHIVAFTAAAASTVLLFWMSSLDQPKLAPSSTLAEVHSVHCLHGCPLGGTATNDLIFRHSYTMSNSDLSKFADWVAYRVVAAAIIPGSSTSRNWKADPWLDENETLEPDDYTGAHAALETDRGHQAPLASFRSTDFWAETNFLSNITPQKSDLNQGPWASLENYERDLAKAGSIVYVLTGPLHEESEVDLPGADETHVVPSGYWKIISEVTSADDEITTAYIFDQDTPRSALFKDHVVPISEVASRTDLQFFPRLQPSL